MFTAHRLEYAGAVINKSLKYSKSTPWKAIASMICVFHFVYWTDALSPLYYSETPKPMSMPYTLTTTAESYTEGMLGWLSC